MMTKLKRGLSLALALVMALGLLNLSALAARIEDDDPLPLTPAESEATDGAQRRDLPQAVTAAEDDAAAIDGQGYPTVQAALEAAQDGDTVQLLADAQLVVEGEDILIRQKIGLDLNEKTLNITLGRDANNYACVIWVCGGGELSIKNGSIVSTAPGGSNATFSVISGSSVSLDHVNFTTNGVALYPRGDAAKVVVTDSQIHAPRCYAIATNASGAENFNVVIELKDSVFTGNTPLMLNVPGRLTMDNCQVTGQTQGLIVRGGTANISNSVITLNYPDDDAEVMANYFNSRNWGSGNMVNLAPLTVGNKAAANSTSYQYPSHVTIADSALKVEGPGVGVFPCAYVHANTTAGNGVTIDQFGENTFEGGCEDSAIVYGNADLGNIAVNASVAFVNGSGYSTVQAALNAAQDGDTVEIIKDTAEAIDFPSGKSLTLTADLSDGKERPTLSGGLDFFNGSVAGSEVVIENLNFTGPKGIMLQTWSKVSGTEDMASLTIRNNTFTDCGVYQSTKAGASSNSFIYAIHINNADLPLNDLTVTGNTFTNCPTGALYASVWGDCTVTHNTITGSGHTVFNLSAAKYKSSENKLESFTVTDNKIDGWGSGVEDGRAMRLSSIECAADLSRNSFVSATIPEEYIKLSPRASTAANINLDQCYWGGGEPAADKMKVPGMKLVSYYRDAAMTDLFTAQATVTHGDAVTRFASIQAAIDAAAIGDVVTVYQAPEDVVDIPDETAIRLDVSHLTEEEPNAFQLNAQGYAYDGSQTFVLYGGLEALVKGEKYLRDPAPNGLGLGSGRSYFFLLEDLTLQDDVTLPTRFSSTTSIFPYVDPTTNAPLTIDLNGHSIVQTPSAASTAENKTTAGWDGLPVLDLRHASLVLTDSVGGGRVVGSAIGVDVYPDHTFTLEGGTITTLGNWYDAPNMPNQFGSVIRARGGEFRMTGGELTIPSGGRAKIVAPIRVVSNSGTTNVVVNIEGGKIQHVPEADRPLKFLSDGSNALWRTNDGIIACKTIREGDSFRCVISGGSFTCDVPEEYLAEGVEVLEVVEGGYTHKVEKQQFKATFVLDGETVREDTVRYGDALTAPDAPEKAGYAFGGWRDLPQTMPARDVTVTGFYTINTYTVTFLDRGETVRKAAVTYNETIGAAMPDDPTRSGYRFNGWADGEGNAVTADTVVTGDFAASARWVRLSAAQTQPETPPQEDLNDPDVPLISDPFRFVDVADTSWYNTVVYQAAALGYMKGVGEKEFAPEGILNRGMMAQILHNIEKNPETALAAPFADLNSQYYVDAVNWGVDAGVLKGYDTGLYGGEDDLTREQAALMLYRYAAHKGLDLAIAPDALKQFSDEAQVSGWAYDAVAWAVTNGLLQGRGNGTADPSARMTRAEAAALLSRFAELIQ